MPVDSGSVIWTDSMPAGSGVMLTETGAATGCHSLAARMELISMEYVKQDATR